MLRVTGILILFVALVVIMSDAGNLHAQSSKQKRKVTGVQGRVYAVGGPARRIDWRPPPYEHQVTIAIHDTAGNRIKEVLTDTKGKFRILLQPGKYYFVVKESFIPTQQGPFTIIKDSLRRLNLEFDSGIR